MKMAHEKLGMALNNQPVVDDLQARAEAAEARVAELEAALRPFAERFAERERTLGKDWTDVGETMVKLRDLRCAVKALAPTEKIE
jgi:hypothetical protein